MAIEILDFPIKNGDFPVRYVTNYIPEGNDFPVKPPMKKNITGTFPAAIHVPPGCLMTPECTRGEIFSSYPATLIPH